MIYANGRNNELFSREAELFISMGSGVRKDNFLGGGEAKEILTSILVGMVRSYRSSYIITYTLFREK